MLFSSLPLIFLALAVSTAFGLKCYNNDEEDIQVDHGSAVCTAVFHEGDHHARFRGMDSDPSIANKDENDCTLKHYEATKGYGAANVWVCYCRRSLCNFPFTWEEFEHRGFTLAPLPSKH